MVTVHIENALAERIGPEYGLSRDEIRGLMGCRPASVITARKRGADRPAFTYSAEQTEAQLDALIAECREFEKQFPKGLRDVVILGIGGSALGARALKAALLHPFHDMLPADLRPKPRLHVLDNVDPAQAAGLLDVLEPATTGLIAISKAGGTAETVAGFAVARKWLVDAGLRWQSQSFIITNEPAPEGRTTLLWDLAEREGIRRMGMPILLGGRYSVLSPVGLVPAALARLDAKALVAGAACMYGRCESTDPWANPAFLLAAVCHQYLIHPKHPRNVCVLMPYSSALSYMADWFIQLWAESLGKAKNLKGALVNAGQTPVRAVGATDQHSQLQLFQEGPHDKVILFVEVGKYGRDVEIPPALPGEPEYLAGKTLGKLLSAEKRGTEFALSDAQRPNVTIHVPAISEKSIGELFFLFWMQTAIMAELMGINAFDQPGVEASKNATRALMGAPGGDYDALRSRMGVE